MKQEETKENELPALSTEQQIEEMAANGNTLSEMALILGLAPKVFKAQAIADGSKYNLAIQRGKLQSEYLQANSLRGLAEAGNITGKQQFNKHIKTKRLQELRARVYYGE